MLPGIPAVASSCCASGSALPACTDNDSAEASKTNKMRPLVRWIMFQYVKARVLLPQAPTAPVPARVPFLMFALGVPMGPESAQALFAACDEMDEAVKPFASEKIFLNFQGDTSAEGARNAYRDEHFSRLQEIKAKYDPANRFRFNINITPAE